jgi:hypothetical protein
MFIIYNISITKLAIKFVAKKIIVISSSAVIYMASPPFNKEITPTAFYYKLPCLSLLYHSILQISTKVYTPCIIAWGVVK